MSVQYLCVCSLYMRMFILCACNVWPRRAFVPCNLCSRFHHCSRFDQTFIHAFAVPFALLPFQYLCSRLCVPFAVRLSQTFARFISNGFEGYFKRVICSCVPFTVCVVSCAYVALFAANLPF